MNPKKSGMINFVLGSKSRNGVGGLERHESGNLFYFGKQNLFTMTDNEYSLWTLSKN